MEKIGDDINGEIHRFLIGKSTISMAIFIGEIQDPDGGPYVWQYFGGISPEI
jgi:hypothetical protein